MKQLNKNGKLIYRRIAVANSEGYIILDFDNILFLRSEDSYTVFHLVDKSEIMASKNLGYFEGKLVNEGFMRVHNSIIVNLSKIAKYKKTDSGCLILNNSEILPVSRNRRIELLQAIKDIC